MKRHHPDGKFAPEPVYWFCTCPNPVTDSLGECQHCHRIPENICSARRRVAPEPETQGA